MNDQTGRKLVLTTHRICRSCGYANGYTLVGKEIEYKVAGNCEWCGRSTVTAKSEDFGWPEPPGKYSNRAENDR